jgi:hypothetical protein
MSALAAQIVLEDDRADLSNLIDLRLGGSFALQLVILEQETEQDV